MRTNGTRALTKSVAVANRTMFTRNETVPVPFTLDALPADNMLMGFLRVRSRAMWLAGISVFFRTPPGSRHSQIEFSFQAGNGASVAAASMTVRGVKLGQELSVLPNYPLPVGSIWQTRINLGGDTDYLPSGIELVYHLRFAQGAGITPDNYSNALIAQGIGFWTIEENFVVI